MLFRMALLYPITTFLSTICREKGGVEVKVLLFEPQSAYRIQRSALTLRDALLLGADGLGTVGKAALCIRAAAAQRSAAATREGRARGPNTRALRQVTWNCLSSRKALVNPRRFRGGGVMWQGRSQDLVSGGGVVPLMYFWVRYPRFRPPTPLARYALVMLSFAFDCFTQNPKS